jgi:hypothetical protein
LSGETLPPTTATNVHLFSCANTYERNRINLDRKMRRIFLHAGEPKTGTSAIQLFLRENREALERLGYLVPIAGMGRSGNYQGLIDAILGQPVPRRYVHCVEAFRQEVNAHPKETVIISAESLDYRFRSDEKRERILSFLQDLGLATTVVIFIRPDPEALSSAYAEQVKSFLYDVTLQDFVRRQRYVHLLKLAQLPEIQTIFRPYNAEVRRTGAAREFLRVIGVPEDALDCLGPERRVNESVGPIAVASAREIRRRIQQTGRQPTDRQRSALKTELFRLIQQEAPESPFYGVDADLLQEIDRRVTENREKFARIAWGKSWQAVFGSDELAPKQCNAFDATTAAPEAVQRYQRITAALWCAAQRIMNDANLSKAAAWDRLHRDAHHSLAQAKRILQWLIHAGIGLAAACADFADICANLA